ncbi:MAG: aminotransferase class I/II-fold pyridoxal phosphate-dependent enzyme [Parabacteroides sp.]|nr:aminotransferase class I/II-fold pyridoxal phosphate-dependent enzyme [Parabacteroides sp.]
MQALILAAGMGKRLGELTQHNTKCMIKIHSVTIIERMLQQLTSFSIDRIILVIGYEGEKVRLLIGDSFNGTPIIYVENPIYDRTNNIYSLSLAKSYLLEDETLLLESDLVFSTDIISRLLADPYPNLAVVAKYQSWMDGTVVMLDNDDNILNFITKKAFNYQNINSYFKTVNIYKFSKEFSANIYVPFLGAYSKALGNNEYYEQVLRVISLLDIQDLKAMRLNGEKWYEIDDLQDLNNAETIFADTDLKLSLIQKRYGGYWRFPELLDYCYLVNPFFPNDKLKNEIKANFNILLTEYPSGMEVNSLLMAKYFGLRHRYACAGNGAAELIKSLVEKLKGNLGVVLPTFEEYLNRLDTERIISFLPDNDNYTYNTEDLISFFENKEISTLLLINPDNPSGNYIAKDDVLLLAEWARKKGIRLVVDESFVDFSDGSVENSLLCNAILERYPNLVIVKSISKSYGVPGLRLGVLASSDEQLISFIKKDVAIWNINSFAEFYMQIFNKYELDYQKACLEFIAERNRFFTELQSIKYLRVIPSQANFFLCEVISTYSSFELAKVLLDRHNIIIKDCSSKNAFKSSNYIRLAVRSEADNNILINTLKAL